MDYGADWSLSLNSSFYPKVWYRIVSSDIGDILYAVTYPGYIYKSTSSGRLWNLLYSAPNDKYWEGIACTSTGQYIVAVSDLTGIYRSSNYGNTW
jgi:photosystem II stability/assembly factor-like uncharacterized protein